MPVKRKAAVAPFRIYSGWDSRQAEAAEVFVASLLEHASIPIEHRFVSADPACPGGAICARSAVTSFSFARFMCPSLCGYQGKALFADGADMLCMADVAELADWDMNGHAVRVVKHAFMGQARPRSWTSLMLLDCAKLTAWTPEFVETAPDEMLMRFAGFPDALIGGLPTEWNALCVPELDPENELRIIKTPEPPEGAKIAHWSYLSQPEGGDWIDRSGSGVWAAARERWRAAQARSNISTDADIFNGGITR